jgi:hypothetical protein
MVFKVNDIKELLVLQMKRFCSAELNVIREDALKLVEKHVKAPQAVVISGLRRA